MLSAKRVIIATIFGIIAGAICLVLGMLKYPEAEFGAVQIVWVFINRTLIGFVIGISAWRIHWAWHGIILGGIVGLPFSYSMLFQGPKIIDFLVVLGISCVFGFFIELFTSAVFKAKVKSA
jgi:hypothetical protein